MTLQIFNIKEVGQGVKDGPDCRGWLTSSSHFGRGEAQPHGSSPPMPNGDVFVANSALKLQIPRRFCPRPELSNASYRPKSCDKIMRGKIILICRKVVSYDFTLHDFVTVFSK